MKVLIPMNGMGNRYIAAGYKDPKPLIKVSGKPMIEHVCDLFPGETDFTFLCNTQHLETTKMQEVLESIRPGCKIIAVPYRQKGPVPVVLEAEAKEPFIDDGEPYVLSYCDFGGQWDYAGFKKKMLEEHYDGAIPSYTGFHPHLVHPGVYGGCQVDGNRDLIEIKEKHSWTEDKTLSWHSAGIYYFGSGALMREYCQRCTEEVEGINGEHYMSMPYYLMAKERKKVHVYPMEKFFQWGTPQDLEEYEYWEEIFAN